MYFVSSKKKHLMKQVYYNDSIYKSASATISSSIGKTT